MIRFAAPLALIALFAGTAPAADKAEKAPQPVNRLAKESSPYLLQHAHNPVDWFPWGTEAFDKAAKENKLVFLSVGYSSCHWCHVMEREAFSDAAVAKYLNEHFVCIKVDREERPDIDQVYIAALAVMGTPGGWPLSMFLTPDGKPIVGGTYWPTEDRVIDGQKVRGFKSILAYMQGLWADKPDDLKEQGDKFAKATADYLKRSARNVLGEKADRALVQAAVDELREEFDPVYGGFGSARKKWKGTKFPIPPALMLIQHEAARTKSEELANIVTKTLDRMGRGGIFDQVGGGFHRYSTERTWTVPHFEKMLYDNAQLAEVYAAAFRATGNPEYRRVLRETLAFVKRELTDNRGGFYSALDADSEGEEGRFYVWTTAELTAALPDKAELELAREAFGADDAPNFEEKYHILTLPRPLAELAAARKLSVDALNERLNAIKAKLLAVRVGRKRPFLDTKVLTGWNGQMIAGYAAAGLALDDAEYKATAARAADFVLANLRDKSGRLLHTWFAADAKAVGNAKIHAYLDDHVYLVHGLLTLHDATGEKRWLDEAKTLADETEKWFADDIGGYFYAPHDNEKLFARGKDQHDGALPAGNSVAARNLVRLWRKTGDVAYQKRADKQLTTFATALKSNPGSLPLLAMTISEFLDAAEKADEKGLDEKPKPGKGPTKSDAYVKVDISASKPTEDGTRTVTIKLDVEKPWHIYGNPASDDELFKPNETVVRILVGGKAVDVTPIYPKGKTVKEKVAGMDVEYVILEGQAVITVPITRLADDKRDWEVQVKFVACKEGMCVLPATVKQKLP